ncbi:MAG TPA: hypothetical protein VK572_05345, partial [Burkholderiales bacterium]|nr:hypothetical protein [Burkholderiales bacterium]
MAFLFFAITDLREKLRKYSTGSVRAATDHYSIRGTSPTDRILLSLGARSDLKSFLLYSFSLIFTNKTCFHQQNSRLANFCRAALHIITKAARIISLQNGALQLADIKFGAQWSAVHHEEASMELILWRHADAEQGSDDKERKL